MTLRDCGREKRSKEGRFEVKICIERERKNRKSRIMRTDWFCLWCSVIVSFSGTKGSKNETKQNNRT